MFDSSQKELSYIDLTDRFPYISSRENEYILVAYHYDDNTIPAVTLKTDRLLQ